MSARARVYVNGRFLQQPITGVQRYGRELLSAWDRFLEEGETGGAEPEIQVLAPRGPIDPPQLRRIGIRQVGCLRGHLWTQIELPFFARDGLLFSPGNIHPLVSMGRLNGVVTVHDLAYAVRPEAYSRAFRLLYAALVPAALRRAEAVITVSRAEEANILERHPCVRGRIHAVHNGAPEGRAGGERSGEVCGPPGRNPFTLWVGTLIRRKNPQGAIDAVALVNREVDLDLVVVGESQRGLTEGGLRLPEEIRERVTFLGQVNDAARLERLYEGAVALVFPSFYESFGLPPLEAMRLGCPVVASDIPALREVCGDAALYVDPYRPADIAGAVRTLLSDPRLREDLRERGQRRAALFSWERCARETLAILSRTIAAGAGAAAAR